MRVLFVVQHFYFVQITYIDGEVERLLLSKERWKLIKDGSKQDMVCETFQTSHH